MRSIANVARAGRVASASACASTRWSYQCARHAANGARAARALVARNPNGVNARLDTGSPCLNAHISCTHIAWKCALGRLPNTCALVRSMRQSHPFERTRNMSTLSASTASHCVRRALFFCRSLARHRRGARNADNAQNPCRAMRSASAWARLRTCTRQATRACPRTGTLQLIQFSGKNKHWLAERGRAPKLGVRLISCAPTRVLACPKHPSRASGASVRNGNAKCLH